MKEKRGNRRFGVRFPVGACSGIEVVLLLLPSNVNLEAVEVKEVGLPSSDATGYFASPGLSGLLMHNTADWSRVSEGNYIGTDTAAAMNLPRPWTDGSFSWEIPARWRLAYDETIEGSVEWSSQAFTIDAQGTVSVSKFGLRAERHTNQVSTVISR